eukprot:c8161_g1_i1.p2 GENE.c8161_g1_i1~~c8161_g1_i1.p2  ORF type:complete len:215 (-),score=45.13 c8161_g1_i1:1725-2339(-)
MGDRTHLENIQAIERRISTGGRKQLNGLVELFPFLQATSPLVVLQAVQSLRTIFTELIRMRDVGLALQEIDPASKDGTKLLKYREWLLARYTAFQNALFELLRSPEPGIQVPAFNTVMHLLHHESAAATASGHPKFWNRNLFVNAITYAFNNKHCSDALLHCIEGYAKKHGDIMLRLFDTLSELVQQFHELECAKSAQVEHFQI